MVIFELPTLIFSKFWQKIKELFESGYFWNTESYILYTILSIKEFKVRVLRIPALTMFPPFPLGFPLLIIYPDGTYRTWTCDPLRVKQMLSQLS